MKYCRYCAFCVSGDCYYCTVHEKCLNHIDKIVSCSDFVLSDLGDVDTGKKYNPRPKKDKISQQQINLFDKGVDR